MTDLYKKGNAAQKELAVQRAVSYRHIVGPMIDGGRTDSEIARLLQRELIRTPGSNNKWTATMVRRIRMRLEAL